MTIEFRLEYAPDVYRENSVYCLSQSISLWHRYWAASTLTSISPTPTLGDCRLRIFFEKQFAAGTLPRDDYRELKEDEKRLEAAAIARVLGA